jgi:hypothetical protein
MKTRASIAVWLAMLFATAPALAIDPGVVQGWLQIEGGAVTKLTHAYAYLERPHEMRILLADREISGKALPRLVPSALTDIARSGSLRGLLVQFHPDNPRRAIVTPLHAMMADGRSGEVKTLSIANNRVAGQMESSPSDIFELAYAAKFSAPLFGSYGTVPGGRARQ